MPMTRTEFLKAEVKSLAYKKSDLKHNHAPGEALGLQGMQEAPENIAKTRAEKNRERNLQKREREKAIKAQEPKAAIEGNAPKEIASNRTGREVAEAGEGKRSSSSKTQE